MTAQIDMFASTAAPVEEANALVGLAIIMPSPCPRCHGAAATIGAGRGPHAASLMCACGQHLGWTSKQTHAFIAETVRQFGKPTEPIAVGDLPITIPAGGPYGFVRSIQTDAGGWIKRDPSCVTAIPAPGGVTTAPST